MITQRTIISVGHDDGEMHRIVSIRCHRIAVYRGAGVGDRNAHRILQKNKADGGLELAQGVGAGGQALDGKQLRPIGVHATGKLGSTGFVESITGEDVASACGIIDGGNVCAVHFTLQAEGIGTVVLRRGICCLLVKERQGDRNIVALFRSVSGAGSPDE